MKKSQIDIKELSSLNEVHDFVDEGVFSRNSIEKVILYTEGTICTIHLETYGGKEIIFGNFEETEFVSLFFLGGKIAEVCNVPLIVESDEDNWKVKLKSPIFWRGNL
jgi:hypothetical protein